MTTRPFTIAIDGPAAAGKGTISKAIAAHFGFAHLDTGLLYRAVGIKALDRGRGVIDPVAAEELAKRLSDADLARDDLRSPRVARAASKVAAISGVRAALFEFQKSFARREGGAVLDGRDIGTVICPNAEVKLFITANDDVRARRRYEELTAKGEKTTPEQVMNDMRQRDARDAGRDEAPMVAAGDSVLLDTSDMSIEEAIAQAREIINAKIAG